MKFAFATALFLFSQITHSSWAQNQEPIVKIDTLSCTAAAAVPGQVDDAAIDACLKADGARFEVHAISPEDRTAVITWRDPNNFFVYRHFSLISKDPAIKTEIFKLGRHDVIVVKGAIARFTAPQKHVSAAELTVETKSTAHQDMPDHVYQTPPDEVLSKTSLQAVVHAIFENGSILVLEYGDRIIPVFVEPRYVSATQNLYRSDVITIHYVVQDSPGRPIHLNLTSNVGGKPVPPVTVDQSILAQSGKPIDITGELVLYPKSPQVPFNVFAVKQDLGNNLRRYYTLVNFNDPAIFKAIREKMQAAWDAEPDGRINDRNKWMSTKIKVRAQGISNTQEPNQANPQVLLDSPDKVEVVP